jgi:hypothetical protein
MGQPGLKTRGYEGERGCLEVSQVNKRVKDAIERARLRAQARRAAAASADKAFAVFLETVATPVTRQVANALKVAGLGFTLGTPGGGLRLAADRGRDDYVEFVLDTSGDLPQAAGRVSVSRGSRTIDEVIPVKPGTPIEDLTEEDVLEFLVRALAAWLER